MSTKDDKLERSCGQENKTCGAHLLKLGSLSRRDGSLCFIQDLYHVNKVTIDNAMVGLRIAKAFVRRSMYSIGDKCLRYNEFQLVSKNRDIYIMGGNAMRKRYIIEKSLLQQG